MENKKLEATLFESIDENSGELTYELWLHDYSNLSSQLIDVALNFKERDVLRKICNNINQCLDFGGF
jgi:hypothetical protein